MVCAIPLRSVSKDFIFSKGKNELAPVLNTLLANFSRSLLTQFSGSTESGYDQFPFPFSFYAEMSQALLDKS
jgi:hypothetical protein